MYNKTKHKLDLTSSILAIIGSCIFGIVCLRLLMELIFHSRFTLPTYLKVGIKTKLSLFFFVLLSSATIIIASILCTKPAKIRGAFKKRTILNLLFVILLAVFFGIALFDMAWLYLILFGTSIAFKIAAIGFKSEQPSNKKRKKLQKFEELKNLRELNILTEEQYVNAVKKIMNDLD